MWTILDSTTRAAWFAATSQQEQLEALQTAIGASPRLVVLTASLGELSRVTLAAPTINTSTTPRRLELGALVAGSLVNTAEGAVAWVELRTSGGTAIMRASAGLSGATVNFAGNVLSLCAPSVKTGATGTYVASNAALPATSLPAWVPSTLYAAAQVPFTNRLDDVDLVGLWSGDSAAHFGSYSGGVYASSYGSRGAHIVHGGGHAANNDNSVFLADYNDLTFKRVGGPTQLASTAAYDAAVTAAPDDLSGWREYAPAEPGSAHTYDCLVYLPPSFCGDPKGALLRPVAGAIGAGPSRDTGRSHFFGLTSLAWSRYSSNYATSWAAGGTCAFDKTRGKIWPINAVTFTNTPSLDVATQAWTNASGGPSSMGANAYADTVLSAHHEQRDIVVISTCRDGGGIGQSFFWFDAAGDGKARNAVTFSSGALPDARFGGGSLLYILETQQLVYWSYQDQDALYFIGVPSTPASDWTWTRQALSGAGRPSLMPPYNSSMYRRMDYAPQLKSIVAVLARPILAFAFGGNVIAIRVVE
jgi:hypothetical protein